ncbi:hypothetical protein N0B44_27980 [Roseibacterium beibuensis]|uniref:Uncharacterized protein n=1 Tax=[Roseibacterium] beibuensis TaxID=1193142 RepID=A0ABP9LM75_9RHOB|nr:hypothetical protein [Roseibacterium beibuensis]MCS6626763.1 hypothetical protein [Roseibacterium beibuensis]
MIALAVALCSPALAQEPPLPATEVPEVAPPDWLSDTVTRPHANIAASASRPGFTIEPLDAVRLDAVGLLPPSITGLPADLWGASDTETLARLFRAQPNQGLPASLAFTEMLALAELDAPADETGDGADLFLARLDMLLDRGALDPALSLMERAGPTDPQVFRRFFDVSLLTDRADRACAAMTANPDIAPTFQAHIFCLARTGDWSAAALSLDTGAALGRISDAEYDVIARFLDPELFEGEDVLPADMNLTPLAFQMRMAVGDRPDLTGLPLAFTHADLSPLAGWRGQIAAAERLTRSGAIEPQQWFAIYTQRVPAASGGAWDRVAAIQALDAAILARDATEVGRRLPPAWVAMQEASLEVAFADIFAERLLALPLIGEAGLLARRVGLLSPRYELVAQGTVAQTPEERFAFDIARGLPTEPPEDADMQTQAIAAAFADPRPPHGYRWFLQNDRLGEALLRASIVLGGPAQDGDDLTEALTLFREVGLEGVARRAALQLLLTDR